MLLFQEFNSRVKLVDLSFKGIAQAKNNFMSFRQGTILLIKECLMIVDCRTLLSIRFVAFVIT